MKRLGKRLRPGAADSHYDLVVIGSGLGALVCAALMSLRGRRVCVLEQHYMLGGMMQTYERAGYEWDVGTKEVGRVTSGDSRLRRLFDVVSQGRLQWCEQPAFTDRIHIGEQQYELPVDHQALATALKAWFPFEHSAIDSYFRLLRSIEQKVDSAFAARILPRSVSGIDRLWRRLSLPSVVWKTTADVLQSLTSNRQLISVLTSRWMSVGLPPGQSSFLAHALGASVKSIRLAGSKALGVQLSTGDFVRADRVVSGIGLMPTLQILPPAQFLQKKLFSRLGSLSLSSGHLTLYLGLKNEAMKTPLPTHGYWLSPGPSQDENHRAYWNNSSTAIPQMHITFPSARDPDWKHRFPGKSTAQIVVPARSEWFDHWRNTGWNNRGDDYGRLKSDFASRMLLPLFRLYPELERALDFSELSTPLSTQHFTANALGESLGLAQTPARFSADVLNPRTPVTNLFLTGSDITVSGVGGAARSGLLTAAALLGAEALRYSDLLRR